MAEAMGSSDIPAGVAAAVQRFAARGREVGTRMWWAENADAVARLLPQGSGATASLGTRLPDLVQAQRASVDVVAAGRLGVAETGSVLVWESRADRAACYLAERLWLVLPAAEIVESLEEALVHIHHAITGEGVRYLTLMTGPSRTADIERTLTIGVHGPRELHVILVGSSW